MKIVLTGASGFIGSHILELYQKQCFEILAIDLKPPTIPIISTTTYIVDDIQNPSTLKAIENFQPNIINHHAAQIDVRFSLENPVEDINTNTIASLKLLDICRQNNSHFIFASSAGAIDGKEIPDSPYGLSKLTTEKYIELYRKYYKIQATIFRYANIYGPRQLKGVIGIFIKKALDNQPIEINGGEQTRDFVYVKDIAQLNLLTLQLPKNNFTIASEQQVSINQLLNLLESKLNKKLTKNIKPYIQGEVLTSCLRQTDELASYLPQNFFTCFEQGLETTVKFWQQNTSK